MCTMFYNNPANILGRTATLNQYHATSAGPFHVLKVGIFDPYLVL